MNGTYDSTSLTFVAELSCGMYFYFQVQSFVSYFLVKLVDTFIVAIDKPVQIIFCRGLHGLAQGPSFFFYDRTSNRRKKYGNNPSYLSRIDQSRPMNLKFADLRT